MGWKLSAVGVEEGLNFFRIGLHGPSDQLLPSALHAQVTLGELPELVLVKRAAAAPLGPLPLDLLLECGGIDRARIAGRGLLDENPILSALLRGGMQAIGALGRVQNCLPLRIAPDSSEFSWMSSSDTTWPLTR